MERENRRLKADVAGLKRIQNEQGRELLRAATDNDYPAKIRQLIDELKAYKDRCKALEEELKREQRSSHNHCY